MPPGHFTTVDSDGGVKLQERDSEGVMTVIAHFEKSLFSIGIFWRQLVHFYHLPNASSKQSPPPLLFSLILFKRME